MAREDAFDKDLVPLEWFDHCVKPESWFDDDLLLAATIAAANASVAATLRDDQAAASGTVGASAASGAVAAQLGDDLGSATATLSTSASASGQLGNDSAALSGTVSIAAAISSQLGNDGAAMSANAANTAMVAATLGNDSAQATATVQTSASAASQLLDDTAAITATVTSAAANASIAAQLGDDLSAATALVGAITQTFGNNTADSFTGTVDNTLKSIAPTTNQSGNNFLEATRYDVGDEQPTLIKFTSLGSIPSDAVITSARIYLNLISQGLDNLINVHRLLRVWDVATSTWNEASTGVNWGTAGAKLDGTDREATPTGSVNLLDGVIGLTSIDVTSDVQGFVNGSLVNNGWLLDRDIVGAFANGFTVFTSSEGADGLRPYLSVTYTVPVAVATIDVQLGGDSANATATVAVTSSLAAVLADDSANAQATLASAATGAAVLANDSASAVGTVSSGGGISALLGNDSAGGTASTAVNASVSALLGDDSAQIAASVGGVTSNASVSALLGDDSAQITATVTAFIPPVITPPLPGGGGGGSYSSGFPSRRGGTPYVVVDRKTIKIGDKTVPVQDLDENDEDLAIILSAIYAYRELT